MGVSLRQTILYGALLAIGGCAGWVGSQSLNDTRPETLAMPSPVLVSPVVSQLPPIPPQSGQGDRNFIAAAVEKVGPAVVRIDAARTVSRRLPDDLPNPLRRFFGEDGSPRERVERGTGSGFLITSDGHVITNAHVVDGADRVIVTLKDGRELRGRVVGSDPVTDVAAVKIDATSLPTVTLGSSNNLIPGQWAIAIGNPLGLDNTVTAGIISATGRSSSQVGIPDRRVRFIQTDAAINPGNSGGPLLNDKGEVIGVNTAIRANAQGLGFAIPIETARRIAEQLFTRGKVEHPFLGIQMVDLTPDLKERINQENEFNLKIQADRGVLIVQVMDGAAAAQAGLQPGDVLLKVKNVPVLTATDVQEQVETSKIGEPVKVEFNRGGQIQTTEVRPTAFPTEQIQ
jgi:S1-C subfamily serine protease